MIHSAHPKPTFMDDATEHKLLVRLDTVKCAPKFPQATALEATRSLRAILGCKATKASMKPRGSTATFEFRNRRRTKEDFVAVEGLDTRGVRDKHVKKPKAKRKGQTKPCIAERRIFGDNNSSQGTGSSHDCANNATPQIFSDTASTTANQHTEGST